jgi:hypothetical protein
MLRPIRAETSENEAKNMHHHNAPTDGGHRPTDRLTMQPRVEHAFAASIRHTFVLFDVGVASDGWRIRCIWRHGGSDESEVVPNRSTLGV